MVILRTINGFISLPSAKVVTLSELGDMAIVTYRMPYLIQSGLKHAASVLHDSTDPEQGQIAPYIL